MTTIHSMVQMLDRLIVATAKATNVLLTLETLDNAINMALSIIGEGIGCDIVAVLENEVESSSRLPSQFNFIYEWAAPEFQSLATNFGSTSLPAELLGFDFLEQYFLKGAGFGGILDVWTEPLRSWLAAVQVQSAYTVPIRVNGQWWGVLCLDYCRAPIQVNAAEISVLMTIADCIGSAIQRERLQRERQEAAQQRATDLEAYNQVLQKRDRLLEATAKVANVLLTVENFDAAINTALGMFLEAAGCDRISILENILESSSPLPVCYKFIYEWATPGFNIRPTESECISAEAIRKDLLEVSAEAIGRDFLERYFLRGEGFGGLLDEWDAPLRNSLAAAQVKSSYYVPIRVNGRWWGLLGFDYCRAAIQLSPAEIAVVRTIADCIGSAIQRSRLQQERQRITQQRTEDLEAYNQVLQGRDRLFEATAKATNVLLTLDHIDVAIDSALMVLIEGTDCDRIEILENVYESSSPMPIRYLNTIQKCLDPKFEINPTDIEPAAAAELRAAFKKYFLEMDGFGGFLEEWDEPLRTRLAALQIQSTYAVPIRVNGQWWGILCFDYCRAPIQFSPAEVAVLRTIADCIGSVIQRERLHHAALRLQQERQQVTQQRTADLEAYNQVLQKRDRLLEATAKATNVLLKVEHFDEAINTALAIILEAAGCDRVKILENSFDGSSTIPEFGSMIYVCTRPGMSEGESRIYSNWVPKEFIERYFLQGEGFCGLLDDFDEPMRSKIAGSQSQSTCAVPIRVNGHWWGTLTLNYSEAIRVSPAEFAVLRTIADCIGSAIQRERLHHAALRLQQEGQQVAQQRAADLEAYNQVLQGRDRLFEATAKAANVLLTLENFDEAVNTALQFIGEGIGCDYVVVLENMFQPPSSLPRSCDFLYEWAAPGLLLLSVSFGSTSLPAELLGLDFMRQYFLEGDGFGGLTEVWNEPLRSALVSVQVQSTYVVPIRVNGQWWGMLGLDYCRAPVQISAAEISVLMAIADCIGSAIQRDRTQKIILQAEQTRVAELVKANSVLKQSLDTFAADSDLDRFIGNTLTVIAQQFDATLIEYWVHAQAGSEAFIHLAYWQGQILSAANGSIVNADPLGMIPFLDIPLSVGDTNIGVLSIYLPVHRTFSRQTIELAHALAQQLTLAVELTRLAEEAQQSALLQERTRMAREIHDTLAQVFGGILMQLQAFTFFAQTQPDQAQTHLQTAQALAQEGLTEARRSVWTLYLETTEYENLDQAIAKFIEQTQPGQATPIHLAIEGTPYSLHPDLGLNLLRIAQEAITNALRHAQSTTIQVHLSYNAQALQLTIRDDGRGFEPQSSTHGFGLLGMQQRASRIGATWNLLSRPGEGTTLMITLTNSQNMAISKA